MDIKNALYGEDKFVGKLLVGLSVHGGRVDTVQLLVKGAVDHYIIVVHPIRSVDLFVHGSRPPAVRCRPLQLSPPRTPSKHPSRILTILASTSAGSKPSILQLSSELAEPTLARSLFPICTGLPAAVCLPTDAFPPVSTTSTSTNSSSAFAPTDTFKKTAHAFPVSSASRAPSILGCCSEIFPRACRTHSSCGRL